MMMISPGWPTQGPARRAVASIMWAGIALALAGQSAGLDAEPEIGLAPAPAVSAAIEPTAAPPDDWVAARTTVVPDAQRDAIGRQLNAQLLHLDNIVYRVPAGRQVQVNTIRTATERDAEAVAATIGARKPRLVHRRGNTVIELVGDDPVALALARQHWAFHAPAARWRVSFAVVPVDSADEDQINALANALVSGAPADRIDALASAIVPGTDLHLAATSQGQPITWASTPIAAPAPVAATSGETLTLTAADPPRDRGLPRIELTAELVTGGPPPPPSARTDLRVLLAATDDWPADDSGIVAEALRIAGPADRPDLERAVNLLAWCSSTFTYGGDRVGSRVGVIRTLITRTGRCWDLSDVYITFARAAGLPARQVAGWLEGAEGHVWCEVLVDGVWLPVDPTAGPVPGVDERYLGYVRSEDGRFPFVYARWPVIERLDAPNAADASAVTDDSPRPAPTN